MRACHLMYSPTLTREDNAEDGEQEEDHGQADGRVEKGPFHSTAAFIDRSIAPKDPTQSRSLGLQKDNGDQGGRDHNLNDV